ncbi:MAG: 30S ribosomal protein S5 [Chloroflexi bacterium]|nr:30S ribosomal protein S5 [Chloroflexota bacterium]
MVNPIVQPEEELEQQQAATSEKVVDISRVAKVVKGGRHMSFRALVVVGDGTGRVGAGVGKADAIPDAVRKGTTTAQKSLITFPLKGSTVPHQVEAHFGAAHVLLKPAPQGTGIIAGSSMRAVLELAGVKDVVAKSFKSQNPINVVWATLAALRDMKLLAPPGAGQSIAQAPLVEPPAPPVAATDQPLAAMVEGATV